MKSVVALGLWFCTSQLAAAQTLVERIDAITNRPEYKSARWGILVVDAATGATVVERNADNHFIPASTTKLYSCSAVLAELGADHHFRTRVVTDGITINGTLFGGLTLIASGDLTMGGRTKPDGTLAFVNGDHTYADAKSATAGVTATDPLAGLNDLAKQIRATGVTEVRGDVLIDDRLFDHSQSSGSGPTRVAPIVINDNVVDFLISAGPNGAVVKMRPETSLMQFDSHVTIGGKTPDVRVNYEGPWRVSLRGTIPAGDKTYVRIAPVVDPTLFARGLFIECLRRAGVDVPVSALGVPQTPLPDARRLTDGRVVAEHVSAPLHEVTKVTLKVSHNLYASTLPLLIATNHKERTLQQGLAREGAFLRELGLDMTGVSFAGGAGGANADSTSPRATVTLLQKLRGRPEYPQFEAGLPILGVDGTLVDVVPADSPARGTVRAKTGTLMWDDMLNSRVLLRSKALAGVMTTKTGRGLIIALFVNDVPLPKGVTTAREGKVLGQLCEILHEFGS